MTAKRAWTVRSDVVDRLRRRWDCGDWLADVAAGSLLEPVTVPLHRPTATDVRDRFEDCRAWVDGWRDERARPLRVLRSPVGGRVSGLNQLPESVVVDTAADLVRLLRVERDVEAHRRMVDTTEQFAPELVPWLREGGHRLLDRADEWPGVLEALAWLRDPRNVGRFVREVDTPGVDTKLVERHGSVLAELLNRVLPPDRINASAARGDLAGRFGFARRPEYVRWRWLGPGRPSWPYREATVRADELAATPPEAANVLVVENEITYLALPDLLDTVAVWGKGYSLAGLHSQDWLAQRRVQYAGDLDTHGFAILDRLRGWHPGVTSVLMDRQTLLSHRDRWGREPAPTRTPLSHLTPDEDDLYQDLGQDVLGPSVRLEQERIDYAWLVSELRSSR